MPAMTFPTCVEVMLCGMPGASSTTPRSDLVRVKSALRLSFPRTVTLPPSASQLPRISFMVVLLPAPFSPTKPQMVPPGRVRSSGPRVKSL